MSQAKLPATRRMGLSKRRHAHFWIAQSKNMWGRGHNHHPNQIKESGYRVIYRIRLDVSPFTGWTSVSSMRAAGTWTICHDHAQPYEPFVGLVLNADVDRRSTCAHTADLPGEGGPYGPYGGVYAAPRPWGTV